MGIPIPDSGLRRRLGRLAGVVGTAVGGAQVAAECSARFGGEFARIAVGKSELTPPKGDRRWVDPAWTTNPLYRRIQQTYLASAQQIGRATVGIGQYADPDRAHQLEFFSRILVSGLAPTNYLPTNPAAVKETFDTAGMNLVRGVRNYATDVRRNGGMPTMVEPGAFEVGRDLALTPGSVVARDDVAEVLRYHPSTDTVHSRPVLVVPPPIGRYYFLDLRPGRSFVEYAVSRGLQTFMLSWRNPQQEQRDWDLDTYAQRVSDAIDTVREQTGSDDVNLIGFCAGGIIATTLLNHLAAVGDTRVHSMSYAVTMLDFEKKEQLGAFASPNLISFARRRSLRNGIISAREMGSAFTWMRPDDLVFNYVVNNYLMGRTPPTFDILAWNADGTNLPGALHAQFLDLFRGNHLTKPGAVTVLGTPVDLSTVTLPTFVSGAIDDHLTAWKNCYRTTQLLGGDDTTFVLSHSGHIASLVNPPGNPKSHYWTGRKPGPDPQQWLDHADRVTGTWWQAWADWVGSRSGERVPSPEPDNIENPLGPAPGRYVKDLPA
ncbi:class II poly(R)-hydroxyalkanoic acid synthase [Rhodococcus olei]|uniref:Class II poly(R)-hydroxyalkanoic acid synthase n=1 Tax=Rhodococcus olei TaxID=2161675 RepID=A0ABP8PFV5_9NOCA